MELRLSLFLILLYLSSSAQQNPEAKNFKANLEKYQNVEAQHGNYLQTAKTNMHYLSWGNPTDRAFIWIHGSLGSAYELEPFAADLCKLGLFFIAIDYYGHGQTALPTYAATQDVAHAIHYEQPKLFLESLTSFIQENK